MLQGFDVASPSLPITGQSEVCSYLTASIYPPMTSPESFILTNATAAQTLVVSEVLPLGYFKISLPMSPAEGEEVRVDCSLVVGATGLQITPTSVSFRGSATVQSHAFSVLLVWSRAKYVQRDIGRFTLRAPLW
jgi:hypothetical protein